MLSKIYKLVETIFTKPEYRYSKSIPVHISKSLYFKSNVDMECIIEKYITDKFEIYIGKEAKESDFLITHTMLSPDWVPIYIILVPDTIFYDDHKIIIVKEIFDYILNDCIASLYNDKTIKDLLNKAYLTMPFQLLLEYMDSIEMDIYDFYKSIYNVNWYSSSENMKMIVDEDISLEDLYDYNMVLLF